MPELPELEVIQEVLNRCILSQTITTAEGIAPGAAIVIRDLTGDATLRPVSANASRWAYLMAND
jgi:formamidopyrimidine-DNA glycosylase